jgi:phosphoribosylamine--glycine ligase
MTKRILVLGSGGREHALASRLLDCPGVEAVVVSPGNAGTTLAGLSNLKGDPLQVAREFVPDLIVVGPDALVCDGLVDRLSEAGFLTYGPSAKAARLEGSKAFMKAFATRWGIRTARYVEVTGHEQLSEALAQFVEPPVVKASGLCAGKGVIVAESFDEARAAALQMLSGDAFGEAGKVVVLEERLYGAEVSVHAICDGTRALVLPAISDHKRIGEGDVGPNTGGMGTVGPAPIYTPELARRVHSEMIERVLYGMQQEGTPFKGTMFAGLMIQPSGEPILLEINVRFGDPETQVLMNLVDGDFAKLLASAARGKLESEAVTIAERAGVCVVLASAGYPAAPRTGDVISGLEAASELDSVRVYHAGTSRDPAGALVTAGGRVLGIVATGASLAAARERAYEACALVRFEGMQLRRDIGQKQIDALVGR